MGYETKKAEANKKNKNKQETSPADFNLKKSFSVVGDSLVGDTL